jgi:hypothetical protein
LGTFADALAAQPEKNRGEVCTVERVRRAMSDDDRQQLDAALADFGISHARLSRALGAMGHKVDQSTVGRHRKNDCKCGDR